VGASNGQRTDRDFGEVESNRNSSRGATASAHDARRGGRVSARQQTNSLPHDKSITDPTLQAEREEVVFHQARPRPMDPPQPGPGGKAMMPGWIKLHRQITENIYWFSKCFTTIRASVDFLLLAYADRQPTTLLIRVVSVTVKRRRRNRVKLAMVKFEC